MHAHAHATQHAMVRTLPSGHQQRHVYPDTKPRTVIVHNGRAQTNMGFRQVAVAPDGEIRPVFSAQYTGHRHERCTRQSAKEGDLVLRFEWYPDRWILYKVCGGELVRQNKQQFIQAQPILTKLPKEVDEWFLNRKVWESFLPAGCGWDGQRTVSQMRKEANIKELFQGLEEPEWLVEILKAAGVSPAVGLPYRWELAAAMPRELDAPAMRLIPMDETKEVDRWTEWVLFYSDNAVDLVIESPTSGSFTDEVNSERETYERTPTKMPVDCIRAIRITRGAYDKGHGSYGVKWQLFSR